MPRSWGTETAEQIARTINGLRERATILYIAHHVPEALALDEIVSLRGDGSGAAGEPQPRPQSDPSREKRS